MTNGFNPQTQRDPYSLLVYTAFQERATRLSHGNVGRIAARHGDPNLARICGVVASDEARHEAFYTRMMAEVLEHDPAGGILAFRSMLRGRIAMPGQFMDDGRDPDLFDHFAIDNSMASNGNRAWPGWSGLDQPRPGDFARTAAALVTSPTSTRSSPICRVAVLGQRAKDLAAFDRIRSCSSPSKTSRSALRAYALRSRRRVAAAERAWRAFAARNPTAVYSPRSTDFTSLCSTASNTTSGASRPRCFRRLAVVDPGRFTRGISMARIA